VLTIGDTTFACNLALKGAKDAAEELGLRNKLGLLCTLAVPTELEPTSCTVELLFTFCLVFRSIPRGDLVIGLLSGGEGEVELALEEGAKLSVRSKFTLRDLDKATCTIKGH